MLSKRNFLLKLEVKLINSEVDYLEALSIRREVFVIEQQVPEEIEIDDYEKSCEHFLLYSSLGPAATGRLRVKDQYIKFERIATRKKFRGQGLGRFLMQSLLTHALEKYPTLTPYMHSQLSAVPFYEKLGWKSEGEIFYEANIPHQTMTYQKT
jgi:predicted GNAT family N-acyltransferase